LLLPPDNRLDVLALLGEVRPMRALLAYLRRQGCSIDTAHDLAECRAAFFRAGGHQLLVVGPDVAVGVTEQAIRCLRALDPKLLACTFGPRCAGLENPARGAVLAGLAPGSRAGVGALLRWLRGLAPD
jgi:hypothetical protein